MPSNRITINLSEQDEQILKKYISQGQKMPEKSIGPHFTAGNEGLPVKQIEQTPNIS